MLVRVIVGSMQALIRYTLCEEQACCVRAEDLLETRWCALQEFDIV